MTTDAALSTEISGRPLAAASGQVDSQAEPEAPHRFPSIAIRHGRRRPRRICRASR
jgi:hypothetical protein